MFHYGSCGFPEFLFEALLRRGVLVVMSLDMEDFPLSGFIDGFRVVEHVPGQGFSAEAFKKREAPHAPFLFAVRSITPRTLWTLRREVCFRTRSVIRSFRASIEFIVEH